MSQYDQISHPGATPYPLLSTKLYIPKQPSYLVTREHLLKKMSWAMKRKLTLLTSPPGFGKTTIVSHWVHNEQINAGWVSLDQGDNDLMRFWSYVIAAFDRLHPGVGHKSLPLLQSISFSFEQMIGWLVNDLFEIDGEVILVLDDYHLIVSEEVHRSLAFFLDRMPPQIHLCIMSRQQLPIPVGTLRVQGELNEIGLSDLKFSEREISSFWHHQTGDVPGESSLKLLSERTEGWVAGVQLAVLSHVSGQQDTLSHFMGNHRYVADYLMEEVILHLPERLRLFLLRTSVLERLNTELCAVLTGEQVEEGLLREIERSHLFLIPLDGEGQWFRYHHLFADFLRSRLKQERAEELVTLHQRASVWYERHGLVREAIEHALVGGVTEKACSLIQSIATEMLKLRELTTLHRWLKQLPDPFRHRPGLLILQIWTELLLGRKEPLDEYVILFQKAMDPLSKEEAAHYAGVREDLVVAQIYQAMLVADNKRAYSLMEALAMREDIPEIAGLPMLFGLGMELNDRIVPFTRGYYGFNGQLKLAERYHRLYHTFISNHHFDNFPFTAYQRAALGEICYERNQLTESLQLAEDAIRIAKQSSVCGAYVPAVIVRSKIYWAQGAEGEALTVICEAMDWLQQTPYRYSHWIDLLQTQLVRFWLLQGNTSAANAWLDHVPWSKQQDWNDHHEFEMLTSIRVLIGKKEVQTAYTWSERLLQKAKRSGRILTELEALLCLAEIHHERGNLHTCMLHLHEALIIGEREGYARIFADHPAEHLLSQYAEVRKNRYMPEVQTPGVSLPYLQQIMALSSATSLSGDPAALDRSIVVPLTAREQEVLQLIAEGLSNKAIAERLVLAEGTVKLHLHRIYGKLQVNGRIQAIQKASQLRLH
ncbi:LuxR C-terminal-related transcriptional regulator [Paenibacillus sp. NPDC056579]|uniref:LuxR C-terminal-related transcriptional regulator n=1 Tax=Paenibacillus sp. NPDC056579 TaxID=3345871 RepID=UPI0036A1E159